MNRWFLRCSVDSQEAVSQVLDSFPTLEDGLVRSARCDYDQRGGKINMYIKTEMMARSALEQMFIGISEAGSLKVASHDACNACRVGRCLKTLLDNAAAEGHTLISFGDDPKVVEREHEEDIRSGRKRGWEELGDKESKMFCATMISDYEEKLEALKRELDAEFEKTLAAARAEHETKVSALKQEMTKAFETQVQELKRKHKAERRELKDEVAELEDELETLRAERSKFAEDVIYRAQEVAKVRREAEEAMQARRDSMDRLEDELDEKRRTIFGLEHQLEEAKEELGAEREARRKAETDLEAEKKRKRPAVATSREDLARATAPSDIFQYSNGRWVFTPEYQERFASLGWL